MGSGVRLQFRSRDGKVRGEHIARVLPVRLGRDASNDCPVAHPFVSQFHAILELVGSELCVRDLHSRNGMESVEGKRLPPGEPVSLAHLGHVFVLGNAVEIEVAPIDEDPAVVQPPSRMDGSQFGSRLAQGLLFDARISSGLAPLPALSLAEPPRGERQPSPSRAVPATPAPERPMSPPLGPAGFGLVDSLPGLSPLPGQFVPAAKPVGAGSSRSDRPTAPAGASRNTEHLTISTETLALLGLRELGASLMPGVPLETTGDVARLLTKLHDLVEVVCRCLVPLRDGYARSVSSTGIGPAEPRARAWSESARRVRDARDPASLATALLDWRNQEFDAPDVVEETIADVAAHHIALTEAVLEGVTTLLDELAPEAIEKEAAEAPILAGVFGRHRALWETYKARYDELAGRMRRRR